ncbi:MAG: cytidine deaminase [Nanoarchaeota archaeon]|nr:cytidine deaminase [Nanoarchaeota archaeon]MBU1030017.1 cytidine deaminase [Nanoarchaeota archaeon]MBU1850390.1 cytidine deaminase [Nanoarchaeota archaeon]
MRFNALLNLQKKLVEIAFETREKARVSYSGYKVGAAVMTENKEIFSGFNLENITYIVPHAEEQAIRLAKEAGHNKIISLVVYTNSQIPPFPCGHCRQIIADSSLLYDMNPNIIAGNDKDVFSIEKISTILPRYNNFSKKKILVQVRTDKNRYTSAFTERQALELSLKKCYMSDNEKILSVLYFSDSKKPLFPSGFNRQLLAEIEKEQNEKIEVIAKTASGLEERMFVSELLPFSFGVESLNNT